MTDPRTAVYSLVHCTDCATDFPSMVAFEAHLSECPDTGSQSAKVAIERAVQG